MYTYEKLFQVDDVDVNSLQNQDWQHLQYQWFQNLWKQQL